MSDEPVTAANSTVLWSKVKETSPAWRGLHFERAILRTQSTIWSVIAGPDAPSDLHLDVPWDHPDDATEDDCWYRVRPRDPRVTTAVMVDGRWMWRV